MNILGLRVLRDHIRRRAKKDKVAINVDDMLKIIDGIIDEHAKIITKFEDWATDDNVMDRLRRIYGISTGTMKPKHVGVVSKWIDHMRRSDLPFVGGAKVDLPGSTHLK